MTAVVLVTNPANGTLTLNADGSFQYTSTAGFSGTDTFRYRVYDGYVYSANIATVTIQVNSTAVPPGWSDEDIGSPSPAGSGLYTASNGVWTVSGGGNGIGGASDQFNYLWEDWSGDGNLMAEVTSLQNTGGVTKAGVMFRGDDGSGTAFADVVVTPGGVNFEWRSANGGSGQFRAGGWRHRLSRLGDAHPQRRQQFFCVLFHGRNELDANRNGPDGQRIEAQLSW